MIPYVKREDAIQGDPLGPVLTPEMGFEVLRVLGERQQLPATGFVAGQAVLSALLELYGDGIRKGPINDIDVFAEAEAVAPDAHQAARLFRSTDGLRENLKDYVFGVFRGYKIGRVEHHGLLNLVTIEPGTRGGPVSLQTLVDGFDFNMVSVGVDPSSGQMKWSEGFERFWNGGPVELQEVAAPQAALPRLLKKSKEMPWLNVDVDDLARDCMVIFSCWKHQARIGIGYVSRPPKYMAMLDAMDPDRKFPRFEEWERGNIEPPGWSLADFSERQQVLLDIVRKGELEKREMHCFGGVSHPVAAAAGLNDIDLLRRTARLGFDLNQSSDLLRDGGLVGDSNALPDADCRTALDIAAVHRSYDAFYELLDLGARCTNHYRGAAGVLVEIHDALNLENLTSAERQFRLDYALFEAAIVNSGYGVRKALAAGADPEVTRLNGQTPFLVAAANGNTSLCVELQAHGANILAVDGNGKSALDLAAEGSHEKTLMTLRAMLARQAADDAVREIGNSLAP